MRKTSVEKLAKLLDAERDALLAGDFESVAALIPEKEALAARFHDAKSADLKLLSATLMRNSVLLAAAKEGVASVVTTLNQQRAARAGLSSYDSAGRATQIGQTTGKTERRF